jgi:hypothetical protein
MSDRRPLLACLLPVRNGADDLPGYLESVANVSGRAMPVGTMRATAGGC